jgi:hypothetical protein
MTICKTISNFNYTITMKDGEVITVDTRFPHEYDGQLFMLLKPINEHSNLLINLDSISKFKWVATY